MRQTTASGTRVATCDEVRCLQRRQVGQSIHPSAHLLQATWCHVGSRAYGGGMPRSSASEVRSIPP